MATFVHLAPESAVDRIRRSGIRRSRTRYGESGVYASPVMQSYFATHQWLRELKRFGGRTIIGIYFRIPDDEVVLVPRSEYGAAKIRKRYAERYDAG